jgi:hypothetical protein
MDAGDVRKDYGALNYIPENALRKHEYRHLPMTSGDEADEEPIKRRRLVKKASDEQENKELTAPKKFGDGAHRDEQVPENTPADTGRFPPNEMPPRYSGGAMDYPPDPRMGQNVLQRPQMEGAEDQYGVGRGIPPLPMGAGRGDLNPQQQQHELMFLQERLQRESGMAAGQMQIGMLGGGDPALLSARGDPLLASRGGMYDPYLMGGQGSLHPSQGEAFPYGDPSFGRGRGLDMLYPSYRGQPPPPYGAAEFSRMPMQHPRGTDPILQHPYNGMMPDGRGFAGRGLDPLMGRGMDPYMDAILAQRYPYTAAALSGGLDRSSLNADFDRAHVARRDISMNQNPGIVNRGLLGQAPEAEIPVNPNAVVLYTPEDDQSLSQYQCVVRKQIELFEAGPIDVDTNAQGRNKPIILGQVGIRCLHCSMIHPKRRTRGATYYPSKFNGFYQAAQNMASGHLCEHCPHVPGPLRRQLLILRERKSSAGGGKDYWAGAIKSLGVVEDTEQGILRFNKDSLRTGRENEEKTKIYEAEPTEEDNRSDEEPDDS